MVGVFDALPFLADCIAGCIQPETDYIGLNQRPVIRCGVLLFGDCVVIVLNKTKF